MKKAISFILFAVFLVLAIILACSSGTEPDGNGNGDTTDVLSPYVSFWNPSDGETEVPLGTSLYVSICDTGEYATGVNQDSIQMTVQGDVVSPALITNSCNGYDLRYVPLSRFDYCETVSVVIDVTDLVGNRLLDSIVFYIEEPGDTCTFTIDTLPPIPGFLTRTFLYGGPIQAVYFSSVGAGLQTISGGSPYSVNFTPGRSFILTDIGGDVRAINLDSSIDVPLTDEPDNEKYPALSPDGHTLAFSRGGDIVLKNLYTGIEEILTSTSQGGREFSFSPDSAYLAYRSGSGSLNPKLFVWRLSDKTEIAHSTLYNDVDCFDWSPAGSEIAVIKSSNMLYYWDVESGTPDLLYSSSYLIDHVQFSAGGYIFFVEGFPAGDIIKVTDLSGTVTDILDLTSEASTVEAMGISNDMEILYCKNTGGTYSIMYYDVDGATGYEATGDIGLTTQIVWY
ncbi:hypothetical protein DRQ36_03770 [bacterium]|nr:MAG: hypothetical protein DRQ36_03770 [bacterium]